MLYEGHDNNETAFSEAIEDAGLKVIGIDRVGNFLCSKNSSDAGCGNIVTALIYTMFIGSKLGYRTVPLEFPHFPLNKYSLPASFLLVLP